MCVSVCMRKKNDYDVEKHKKNKNKILYKCVVPTRACVRCARIRFGFLSLRFRANAETHNVQLHCCYNKYTYTDRTALACPAQNIWVGPFCAIRDARPKVYRLLRHNLLKYVMWDRWVTNLL